MNKNNNNDYKKVLVEDQLKRVSSEFELDVLRLIKTQSMISSTSEIIEQESQTVRERSGEFQEILNEFSSKILEKTQNLSTFENDPELQRNINDILSSIEDYKTRTRKIREDVEKATDENLKRLSSLHEFYSMELNAFQQGLDSRIQELQNSIVRTLGASEHELDLGVSEYTDVQDKTTLSGETETSEKVEKATEPPEEFKPGKADKPHRAPSKTGQFPKRYIAASILVLMAIALYVFQTISPGFMDSFVAEKPVSEGTVGAAGEDSGNSPISPGNYGKLTGDDDGILPETMDTENVTPENGNSGDTQDTVTAGSRVEDSTTAETGTANERGSNDEAFYTIRVKGANVRTGPGKGYQVVTVVKPDDMFQKTGDETDRWVRIKTDDGIYGWIAKSLVRETGNQ